MKELRKYLHQDSITYTNNNLKQSIYRLKLDELIYEAGRGWYSTIKEEFILNRRPIEKIVEIIKRNFPLLEFSCWSTEQLKGFFHQKKESEKFVHFNDQTVILRASITHREPKDNYFASIEKLIVDLYMETKKIGLLDKKKFKRITKNVLNNYRINLSKMLDYAHNRKIRSEIENIVHGIFMYTNATI